MKLTFNQWLLELKRQRVNKLLSLFETPATKSLNDLSNAYFDNKIKSIEIVKA